MSSLWVLFFSEVDCWVWISVSYLFLFIPFFFEVVCMFSFLLWFFNLNMVLPFQQLFMAYHQLQLKISKFARPFIVSVFSGFPLQGIGRPLFLSSFNFFEIVKLISTLKALRKCW